MYYMIFVAVNPSKQAKCLWCWLPVEALLPFLYICIQYCVRWILHPKMIVPKHLVQATVGRRRHWKYTSHITRSVGPSEGVHPPGLHSAPCEAFGLSRPQPCQPGFFDPAMGWLGWFWWWENMKEGFVCGIRKRSLLLNAMWLKGMWFDWMNRNMIVIKMWFCQKITEVQLQTCFAEIVFPCVLHGQLFDTNTAGSVTAALMSCNVL